jgi:hypothetical protein
MVDTLREQLLCQQQQTASSWYTRSEIPANTFVVELQLASAYIGVSYAATAAFKFDHLTSIADGRCTSAGW